MNGVKLCFSSMIALGVGVAIGCGTSSSQAPGPEDGGQASEAGHADEAGPETGNTNCNPLFGQLCAQGQTCCFSGLNGTCVSSGACSAPFQVSCIAKADCNGGVCCGSVQLPAGFDASGLFDASDFDASGFDASGFDASGFGLTLQCASTCAPPDFELCATTQDCPSGYRCAGGTGGGGLGGILACIPLDAGAPPAGGNDAGDGGDGNVTAASGDGGDATAGGSGDGG
jgi:hypothetical protein